MVYNYESQRKTLADLVKNFPHDMEKFKKHYEIEQAVGGVLKIEGYDILLSTVWTVDEKVQLIRMYGYDKDYVFIPERRKWDMGFRKGIEGFPLIDICIKNQDFAGLQMLLNLGVQISIVTIARIIEYIKDPGERYRFCELLVAHYGKKENIKVYNRYDYHYRLTEIPTLCDRYVICNYSGFDVAIYSAMEDICATNDLELVKLFLPTVKNINSLFQFAVNSKNIEMVKLFIEFGADVNYQELEFRLAVKQGIFKTPLKIAIDNNDLEMVKFLYQNGADLDFVDKSERMQEFINTLGENETEKETHKYADSWDSYAYIAWSKTSLEYAINIGKLSNEARIETKRLRPSIVKFLYENGATFGDGQINYTDLICFTIKLDDYEGTEYYFEEALKNNAKLDFVKIISFIHITGKDKKSYCSEINYSHFQEGAVPWLRMCEKYSKLLDFENYDRNVRLMLEKIFKEFLFNDYQFNLYQDIMKEFSKALPPEILQEIPALFGSPLFYSEEILSLGYNINCVDENGNNTIIDWLRAGGYRVEGLEWFISLGADINYQNGNNALSMAISQLPEYDIGTFIHNFNSETGELNCDPENYEKERKALVKRIIDLSSDEIIMSDSVRQAVYDKIKPGYPQIIYNEILEALSKRGFKVEDDYFTKSVTFLDESYSWKYVTKPWQYLSSLYGNFKNKSIGTNQEFPKIEDAQQYEFGSNESKGLLCLIIEHINRNFITTREQISEPDAVVGGYINSKTDEYENLTSLQLAQNKLLREIARYIGNLDYRQIMYLINGYSLIDNDSIVRNGILPTALNIRDIGLCRELIRKGISIVCYDKHGRDITEKKYSIELIRLFNELSSEYNPDQECKDLSDYPDCSGNVRSLKKHKNKGENAQLTFWD